MASPRVSDAEQRRRSKRAEMLAAAGFLLEAMGVEPAMAAKLGKLATQARAGEIGGDL